MIRIVDICAFYTPAGGGVRTYVEQKLAAARPGREEVIILAPGERDATVAQNAAGRIVTIAAPRFPLDRRYRYFADEVALHRALDRLAPDVVEASSPWSSASMVARWQGQALRALVMHADPLSAYAYRWFGGVAPRDVIDRGFDWFWRHLRRLDADFDMVLSASHSLSRRLVAGGLTKVRTNPMGVTPGLFSPQYRSAEVRRQLLAKCGLPEEATLLLGLGRHGPEKRWPMVIEAAIAAGNNHPVGLLIFGSGRDEAKVARAARFSPHVYLAAPERDRGRLATLLASGDALVHGCESETFCMVAAEAQAAGLPLILPDEGGASDQFRAACDQSYTACSARSMAEAIARRVEAGDAAQSVAAALADRAPAMDTHFRRLFDDYHAAIADGAASSLRSAVNF
ncbi:glycosyltransferase [uncultured Sphingomonas sp.]|uniref:glycosyltransferase n=1 Tax=uncultured Sphingomonas sp. TaxID=158754 RepID=UPI00345BCA9C